MAGNSGSCAWRASSLDRLPVSLSTSLDGELRASVVAAGNLAEVERAEVAVNIDGFSGTWDNQPFAVTSPSRLRYADERLTIERLELVAAGLVAHRQWRPAVD